MGWSPVANLRRALLDNKCDLYTFMTTMTNCNGGGQCGTCAVVVENDAFGPRNDWEDGKLKGKPGSARLACQTVIAGNSATVVLQPQ